MDFLNKAKSELDQIIEDRRYLHKHPELSGQEDNTVRFITGRLKELGIPFAVVEKGGVLGYLGGTEEEKEKKTILLRADMDALPVPEAEKNLKQTKVCRSEIPGVSHACGHDAHTAMLLSAAKILKEYESTLPGRVILFFERGEEAGGHILYLLRYIYNKGIRVDGCYGMHVRAELPSGMVGIESGVINAGGFGFEAVIHGKGGHGARPHQANSPIDCFVQLYQAISGIPVRNIDARDTVSFSLGRVTAGAKRNIIPEDLTFAGSYRFFDHQVGKKVKGDFLHYCKAICAANGCSFELIREVGPTLPLVNDPECVSICEEAIRDTVGEQSRIREKPEMGSESFSAAQRLWPGAFLHLGIGNPALGSGAAHHSPAFDIDESVLYIGTAMYAAYAFEFLKHDRQTFFDTYPGTPDDLYREICYKVDE